MHIMVVLEVKYIKVSCQLSPCKPIAQLKPFGFYEFSCEFSYLENSRNIRVVSKPKELDLRNFGKTDFFSQVFGRTSSSIPKEIGSHFLALSMLQMIYFGRLHFLGNGTFIFKIIFRPFKSFNTLIND